MSHLTFHSMALPFIVISSFFFGMVDFHLGFFLLFNKPSTGFEVVRFLLDGFEALSADSAIHVRPLPLLFCRFSVSS